MYFSQKHQENCHDKMLEVKRQNVGEVKKLMEKNYGKIKGSQ